MRSREVVLTVAVAVIVLGVTTVAGLRQPTAKPLDVLGYTVLLAHVNALKSRATPHAVPPDSVVALVVDVPWCALASACSWKPRTHRSLRRSR